MGEEFEWLAQPDAIAGIAAQWDALAAHDATPFASFAWFQSWWEAFGAGATPNVVALRRDGELAAVLPLLRRGRRADVMANFHTPVFRVAARDPDGARAVWKHALERVRSPLHVVLREGDPGVEATLATPGRLALVEEGPRSPAIDLSVGRDLWWGSLSRNRVKDLRRRGRRLEEAHAVEARALEPPNDLERELAEGLRVEGSGWKTRRGTAIASRPETLAFYRALAQRLHAAGTLRFSTLRVDGELAAWEYMLVHGGSVWSLKGGYDERFAAYAPGLLVQAAAIERAFALGLRSYELLGADEPWKRSLANAERRHVRLRSFSGSVPGRLSRLAWSAGAPRVRRLRAALRAGARRVRPG